MQISSASSSYRLNPNLADNSVVCLMAPTASGKTALAYELYDTGRYELISVDSALIYRDMNIGTAKPTAAESHVIRIIWLISLTRCKAIVSLNSLMMLLI